MSSNDRAAKARDKAFKAAAWVQSPDEPADVVTRVYRDAWKLIWTRALRYADRWWDEQLAEVRKHLEEARGKAVIVSLDLVEAQRQVKDLEQRNASQRRSLEGAMAANRALNKTNSDLRSELDQLKKDIVERQPIPGSMATRFTTRALDEVTEQLDASERKLHVSNMRIENLKRRLGTCEAQLNEARALTTRGTTTVFEENERLMAKVRELEALNESLMVFNDDCMKKRDRQLTILAEEKGLTSTLRAENKHLGDEVRRLTSLLADAEEKLTPAPSRIEYGVPPCNYTWIAEGYTHTCTEPKGHNFTTPGGHRCHCRAR